ncbi:MAG: primosomal protein N' [Oscillospiraceae bacterium]|jgi:primosomal protein N' (replication factor Y)|nr:primosomal protein N' [Oscillospiraceae bacterium]
MNNENLLLTGLIAQVAVEKSLYSFDLLFDYLVPYDLINTAAAGKRVIVDFGRGHSAKKRQGMILSIREALYEPSKIKRIAAVVDSEPLLSGEMLKLVVWLKENTFCTYFDAVKTVIPAGLGLKLSDEGDSVKTRYKGDVTKILSIAVDFDFSLITLTPKQQAVIEMLEEYESACVKEICIVCGVTSAVISNLLKKGVLEERLNERGYSRALSKDFEVTANLDSLTFSPAQQNVFNGLKELADCGQAKCALLRGITGSGKTSVFIKLIEHTLNKGKTAIMLVPEISLTPQMTEQFKSLFGNKVAIIHSNLSLGQRADEWGRIKNGEAGIIVGTRSAVFAPLKNIGVIIIDEEGEHSYKSDRSPRYHARNVAKQRAFHHNALLLLASATPSIESYHFAKTERYSLFELNERYSKAILPDVYIVDMKTEYENGNRSNFSGILLEELADNLERGEQSLILLNRRGYHTYARCVKCGAAVSCPVCLIPLTYHKKGNSVQCHYCAHNAPMPDVCENCKCRHIYQSGTGTQRVEDEIGEIFPDARILRMDADTTVSKTAFETKFAEFKSGEYDIMVGTQMVAKGLDFENITLVGVLGIDKALYSGDYLGYEKTFSLITQVVGRSGRGSKKGRAYLQTFTPDHYVLNLAAAQDYAEFYGQEAEVRKALIFPPFCDIFLIGFSAVDEKTSEKAAEKFLAILSAELNSAEKKLPYRVLGPTKSGTGRINGKYRHKLIIKCKNSAAFRRIISNALKTAYSGTDFKYTGIYVDINGEIL